MSEYHIKQDVKVENYYVVDAESEEEALEMVASGYAGALDCEEVDDISKPYIYKIEEN